MGGLRFNPKVRSNTFLYLYDSMGHQIQIPQGASQDFAGVQQHPSTLLVHRKTFLSISSNTNRPYKLLSQLASLAAVVFFSLGACRQYETSPDLSLHRGINACARASRVGRVSSSEMCCHGQGFGCLEKEMRFSMCST